jgi:hypothetical protein
VVGGQGTSNPLALASQSRDLSNLRVLFGFGETDCLLKQTTGLAMVLKIEGVQSVLTSAPGGTTELIDEPTLQSIWTSSQAPCHRLTFAVASN